jgi:sulfofructosephosphate aldolase
MAPTPTIGSAGPDRPPVLVREDGYRALARAGGGFAMLALDQRVSLQNIFQAAGIEPREPALDAFRSAVAASLASHASAILLDRGYLSRVPLPRPWSGVGGLIVAADRLRQAPGQPAHDSSLDRSAATIASANGARALKLMAVWVPGAANEDRVRLVRDFIRLAREHSMLAIVEGIVPSHGEPIGREPAEELLRAASALAEGADLYKAQLPIHRGDVSGDVEALSREMTETVSCPWVVLSTGVAPDQFANLLAAACRGGASGFLAGRAIWSRSVGAPDPGAHLAEHATGQLDALSAVVDAWARPWWEASGTARESPS